MTRAISYNVSQLNKKGYTIMAKIRVAILLVLGLLIGGCSALDPFDDAFYERASEGVLPSDDPLVLAAFVRELNAQGIAFKRNYEGRFFAIDVSETGELESVAKDMTGMTIERRKIPAGENCAVLSLQSHLHRSGALFARVQEDDGPYLHIAATDYESAEVDARLAEFTQACQGAE
ncbi:MAG: hypothetical protein R3228_01205 [Halioglobus sp.]|nr:hypothetical protein [Halioglobus sp.]